MTLWTKLRRSLLMLPLVRPAEKTLKRVREALVAFVVTSIVAFLCLLIIATYFLVHLIQGR